MVLRVDWALLSTSGSESVLVRVLQRNRPTGCLFIYREIYFKELARRIVERFGTYKIRREADQLEPRKELQFGSKQHLQTKFLHAHGRSVPK
jgi:hypothetical protein